MISLLDMENDFVEEPQDLVLYLKDTAMFACEIGGAPTPIVRWYKDEVDMELANTNYVVHPGGVLEIRSVQLGDFGRYKCKVENVERSRISRSAVLRLNADNSKLNDG